MSLGLFGDVPVSHFSGVPNIQVPLYTFQENGISIPLSLNHHASGFRPDMHPGWVGMGWSLSVGSITRTIKDDRDDNRGPENNGVSPGYGFYYSYNIIGASDWNTQAGLNAFSQNYNHYGYDTQPDEFSFNFPGYSGKFYLDHTRNWKVKCDRPVKVDFDGNMITCPLTTYGYPNNSYFIGFAGFTITDEFGTKYIFGYDTDAIEYGISFFNNSADFWKAQSWNLTRIIHADGYEVVFKYERDDLINQMYNSYNFTASISDPGGWGTPCVDQSTPGYNESLQSSFTGQLISPVYLSAIEGSTQKVIFKRSTTTELKYSVTPSAYQNPYEFRRQWFYNENASNPAAVMVPLLQMNDNGIGFIDFYASLNKLKFKQLDTVEVQNKIGFVEKRFKFYYTADLNKRLRLDSLKEMGKFGEVKPSYKFSYKGFGGGSEPPYLDIKNDHWGFYNGEFADVGIDENTYYNLRNKIDTLKNLYGVIDSIIYPTGGVTKFYFQHNKYSKRPKPSRTQGIDATYNTNTNAGGVRIKMIESYDRTAPHIKNRKEYFYVRNYNSSSNVFTALSSGVLNSQIKYAFGDYYLRIKESGGVLGYRHVLISSQSVFPASENSANTHIGYSEVVEKRSDGSYTKHLFTNLDNGHLDDSATVVQTRTPCEPVSSRDMERGLVFREESYMPNDKLLRKVETDFVALNQDLSYVRSIKSSIFSPCLQALYSVYEGTAYKIYTYSYLPSSQRTVEYHETASDSLVSTRFMFYDLTYRLLIKDSTVDSKGQALCNYYRFPFQVINYTNTSVGLTHPVRYMVNNNIIGYPLETISTIKIGSSEFVRNASSTSFKGYQQLIKPYQQYQYEAPSSALLYSNYTKYQANLTTGVETYARDTRLKLQTTAFNYDLRGNLVSMANDQDIINSTKWSHNFKYPVAKLSSAYNNIEYNYISINDSVEFPTLLGPALQSTSFRNYATGDITISVDFLNPASGTDRIELAGELSYGTEVLNIPGGLKRVVSGTEKRSHTFTNLPPGLYTLLMQASNLPNGVLGKMKVKFKGASANQISSNTSAQFFYEGFEESFPSGITPFAGSNCRGGDYTVPYIVPSGGFYLIDYRYLDAGVWKYMKKYYSNQMTITDGDAVDEVRVYLDNSQIFTYTYDPNIGLTSQTDVNAKMEKYYYDGLGRLEMIKDDTGNILKKICYTYYGQTQNCSVDTAANYVFTGDTRCKPCPQNAAYYFNVLQKLKRNINPHSVSYNDTTWVDSGTSTACVMNIPANWVATGAPLRCQANELNNTGKTERQEIDTNPCSPTHNTYRWVEQGTNTTMCPVKMLTLRYSSVVDVYGASIRFTGSGGDFLFYFPYGTPTNYALGTIPWGFYVVQVYGGGANSFTLGGSYTIWNNNEPTFEMPVGGTNYSIYVD